jgi:hypothetical protein
LELLIVFIRLDFFLVNGTEKFCEDSPKPGVYVFYFLLFIFFVLIVFFFFEGHEINGVRILGAGFIQIVN